MKVKKLNRESIIKLENAVENGVYVTPARLSKRQDAATKRLIERMKKIPVTTRNISKD